MIFKNKKGQDAGNPLLAFIIVIFFLFLFGPPLLKGLNDVKPKLTDSFSNASFQGNKTAVDVTNKVLNFTINSMDYALVFLFVIFLIALLISVFLIDSYPFWAVIFILTAVMSAIIGGLLFSHLVDIYNSPLFADELEQLPMTYFLINNWAYVFVGVVILMIIIIYGKFKFFAARPIR